MSAPDQIAPHRNLALDQSPIKDITTSLGKLPTVLGIELKDGMTGETHPLSNADAPESGLIVVYRLTAAKNVQDPKVSTDAWGLNLSIGSDLGSLTVGLYPVLSKPVSWRVGSFVTPAGLRYSEERDGSFNSHNLVDGSDPADQLARTSAIAKLALGSLWPALVINAARSQQ